jgi:hypothetical protein
MLRKTYLLVADQNRETHYPVLILELDWHDLVQSDPDFASSISGPVAYSDPRIKEVMILVYVPRGHTGTKRRIIGIMQELDVDGMKNLVRMQLADLGIKATFHTEEEFKKVVPFNAHDREILTRLRAKGKPLE